MIHLDLDLWTIREPPFHYHRCAADDVANEVADDVDVTAVPPLTSPSENPFHYDRCCSSFLYSSFSVSLSLSCSSSISLSKGHNDTEIS